MKTTTTLRYSCPLLLPTEGSKPGGPHGPVDPSDANKCQPRDQGKERGRGAVQLSVDRKDHMLACKREYLLRCGTPYLSPP